MATKYRPLEENPCAAERLHIEPTEIEIEEYVDWDSNNHRIGGEQYARAAADPNATAERNSYGEVKVEDARMHKPVMRCRPDLKSRAVVCVVVVVIVNNEIRGSGNRNEKKECG